MSRVISLVRTMNDLWIRSNTGGSTLWSRPRLLSCNPAGQVFVRTDAKHRPPAAFSGLFRRGFVVLPQPLERWGQVLRTEGTIDVARLFRVDELIRIAF